MLSKRRIQPLITSVSASTVVLALDARDLSTAEARFDRSDFRLRKRIAAPDHRAIISLVGDGLRSDPRLASRVFKATDEVELGMILHGSSPITMSFVVAEAEVERVVARLHKVFFDQIDPQIFQ